MFHLRFGDGKLNLRLGSVRLIKLDCEALRLLNKSTKIHLERRRISLRASNGSFQFEFFDVRAYIVCQVETT